MSTSRRWKSPCRRRVGLTGVGGRVVKKQMHDVVTRHTHIHVALGTPAARKVAHLRSVQAHGVKAESLWHG